MKILESYIMELCSLCGPSGEEGEVYTWLRERWAKLGVLEKQCGNLLLRMDGDGTPFLVAAHADELSFMVRAVTSGGFLKVIKGQSDNWNLPHFLSQPVTVLGDLGKLPGVFCGATGHILTQREKQEPADGAYYFVDIGASSENEARELGVHEGSRMVWDVKPVKIRDNIFAKAIDDRLGLALITRLAEKMFQKDQRPAFVFAATCQEELGYVGASSLGSEGLQGAVVIDNGLSGDIPGVEADRISVKLNGGPILVYRDSGVHYTKELIARAEKAARKYSIPFQRGVFFSYATDGAAFLRNGLDTMLLAPPVRYTHSPREMVSMRDVKDSLRLLDAFFCV